MNVLLITRQSISSFRRTYIHHLHLPNITQTSGYYKLLFLKPELNVSYCNKIKNSLLVALGLKITALMIKAKSCKVHRKAIVKSTYDWLWIISLTNGLIQPPKNKWIVQQHVFHVFNSCASKCILRVRRRNIYTAEHFHGISQGCYI